MIIDKMKEYTSKFPFGLKEFTIALSPEISLAIVYLLHEKGELTNEEIIQQFGQVDAEDKKIIIAAVENLGNWGIIRRTKSKMIGTELISKYTINDIYSRLLENCIETLEQMR